MTGTVYFNDGHTETILSYVKHDDEISEFETDSGQYLSRVEPYISSFTDSGFPITTSKLIYYQMIRSWRPGGHYASEHIKSDIDHISLEE